MTPFQAYLEHWRDGLGGPGTDPGIRALLETSLRWLCRAQDRSATQDGGVARHFSLRRGWGPSYPETTGYTVSTLLECAPLFPNFSLVERAHRMLDWLVTLQRPDGAYYGGVVGDRPQVPVTFNSGQILLGLASGVAHFGDAYAAATRRAADWLVATQDADGCWRRFPTPFAKPGEKTYETHVGWGLLEAARVIPDHGYSEAALRHARWALTRQQSNGWFADCCLEDPRRPLTHTLGYALRGLLEVYRYTRDAAVLDGVLAASTGLRSALETNGRLPGRLDARWQPAAPWSCLTGSMQISLCWLLLSQLTSDDQWLDAARRANRFVRSTVRIDAVPDDVRGAVKGSFPVGGGYCAWEYPSWATKFCIDAHLLEYRLVGAGD